MQKLNGYCFDEIEIKRSRFLAEGFPVQTQNEVRAIIKSQKEKYNSARHVVHAFVLGEQKEILGASDDGEPSGTAGAPVLSVLKGQDISFMLITVTRWFGGILLGTGGLVKAYTTSAKNLIEKAKTQNLILENIRLKHLFLKTDYTQFNIVKKLLEERFAVHIESSFGERVEITCEVPADTVVGLSELLKQATKGEIEIRF